MSTQDVLLQNAEKIETIEQFKQWMRNDVRRELPHGAFACGHGRMHAAGVATDYIITVDFPHTHLAMLCNPAGGLDTPLMRRWMMYRKPQLFDVAAPPSWPEISLAWLRQFFKHDLRNAAVHAMFDPERCLGSYFSFHRLPESPGDKVRDALLRLTPIMHEVLVRVIRHVERLEQEQRPDWSVLTQRETEILPWVGRGKSNAEIAEAMLLSENTIKHHVSNIFEKTGISNRASLVAALGAYPPGMISKGTKVL